MISDKYAVYGGKIMRTKLNKNRLLILITFVLFFSILGGCNNGYENNDTVRLAYFGEATDLPLLTAVEEGYFEEEGIKVELVKIDRKDFNSAIKDKTIDGATSDYQIFKSIEAGTGVKIGVGLNSGAIEVLVNENKGINSIGELKNKKVAIQNAGDGIAVEADKLFNKNSIEATNEINWSYYPNDNLVESIKNGEVDGIIRLQNSDSQGENLQGIKSIYKVNTDSKALMQGHSHHQNDYTYMNFAALSNEIMDSSPEKAAGILRAWIKGTNKVNEDKENSIKKAINKGYLTGDYEAEYNQINRYMWMPSVKSAKDNIKDYISVQKKLGILKSELNEDDFLNSCFKDVLPFWE